MRPPNEHHPGAPPGAKERPGHPEHRGRAENAEASNLSPKDSTPRPGLPAVGEIVSLNYMPGRFEVMATDRALVTVRTATGATFRTGWRTVVRDGAL